MFTPSDRLPMRKADEFLRHGRASRFRWVTRTWVRRFDRLVSGDPVHRTGHRSRCVLVRTRDRKRIRKCSVSDGIFRTYCRCDTIGTRKRRGAPAQKVGSKSSSGKSSGAPRELAVLTSEQFPLDTTLDTISRPPLGCHPRTGCDMPSDPHKTESINHDDRDVPRVPSSSNPAFDRGSRFA